MSVLDHMPNLRRVFEDDLFQGADQEELDTRRNINRAELEQKRQKFIEERGEVPDMCPHCGVDLREDGVYQDEISYGTINRYYEDSSGNWEFGESDWGDSDLRDSYCANCEGTLVEGRDWGEA